MDILQFILITLLIFIIALPILLLRKLAWKIICKGIDVFVFKKDK